eukprot:jgi/Orpsp1_1/1175774/evm.model.c7180000055160.1
MELQIDETETETERLLLEKNEQKKIIKKLKNEGKAIEKAQQQLNEKFKRINSELSKIPKNKNYSCLLEKLETRELLTKQKQELKKKKALSELTNKIEERSEQLLKEINEQKEVIEKLEKEDKEIWNAQQQLNEKLNNFYTELYEILNQKKDGKIEKEVLLVKRKKELDEEKIVLKNKNDENIHDYKIILKKKEKALIELLNKIEKEKEQLLMEINEQKKIVEKLRAETKEINKTQRLLNGKLRNIETELLKIPENKKYTNSLEINEKERLLIKQKKELEKEKMVLKNKKIVKEKEIYNQKFILKEKEKTLSNCKPNSETKMTKRAFIRNLDKRKIELRATAISFMKKVLELEVKINAQSILKNMTNLKLTNEEKNFLNEIRLNLKNNVKENEENELNEKKLIISQKEKRLEHMKDMIYFSWEKAQYLETIFSDKNAISINSLNGQFNQLISRQNQLNTMKNDLITKRKLLQDRYYAYRRELQEQINHNSNENFFDSKKGLKKEEKLLKNKIRNKEKNQNQNQNQIQEYNKALIQKEFIKYRKYRFNNYVSFSILKNKNENKNEIDNRNENENDNDNDNENKNDYKINVKEKVLKLENQLYQLEEEQKSLNEKKVIKYNKFLKSQLKSKFELKIKRKNLRDKLKQLQLERSELDEKLKEATSE